MSELPPKPDVPSPSVPEDPIPPGRGRRGRGLLVATATSAAFTVAACGAFVTTNPAPCVYDGGLIDDDCNPDNGTNETPSDEDAGSDAGLPQVP
ncbi:hypothetical protein LY474_34130 [Myxococcus stipitatus]|uniref:hypothetical protein n=1 Tax=Myxococcus stipitatus TaxID=83455 RepID=UPI001F43E16C|nr:hypothetical protein [Myxococcus stipitatus]MCE9672857.1 hypothetical protein [Myxococcus stipitatus]